MSIASLWCRGRELAASSDMGGSSIRGFHGDQDDGQIDLSILGKAE